MTPAPAAALAVAAALGRGARLRDPADAAVLDHPVAPLRLHDDQRRAAGLRRGRHLRHPGAALAAGALRAGLRCAAARVRRQLRSRASPLAQRVPFNPLEILWDPRAAALPAGRLRCCCSLPFFCAATALCLTFTRFGGQAPASTASTSSARGGQPRVLALLFVLHAGRRAELSVAALGLRRGGARPAWPSARRRARVLARWSPRSPAPLAAAGAVDRASSPPTTRNCARRCRPGHARRGRARRARSGWSPSSRARRCRSATRRAEPQRAAGAAAATRRVHRRRRAERADPLRRPPEPLAYLDYLTSALPYHLLGARACWCWARAPAPTCCRRCTRRAQRRCGRAEPAGRRSGASSDFADFSGRPYAAPGVRAARRRGARLRRRAAAGATT